MNVIEDFLEKLEPKLSESTVYLLKPMLSVARLPKKHMVIKAHELSKKIYLICKGASRSYYLHNGTEVHTWFAFENEIIGSLRNFNNLPSRENIELLEDSLLIAFDIPGIKSLMKTNVEMADFVNEAVLEYAFFVENKFFDFHMKSAHEKYTALITHEPEVFQRVPLTYIASYLGITRETLSRMRSQ